MSKTRPLEETARDRAMSVLIDAYDGEALCHDLLADLHAHHPLSPADEALAAELAIGVSRHRITCEHLAARYYRGRWLGLRVPQRLAIALGVYQLCWLDRIPEYAAVDESVRLAARYGRGAASVANAILRSVAAARGEIVPRADDHPPRRFLPIDASRARLFTEDVFPDPARRILDHLIAVYAHPSWLVERWHRRFKTQRCREILEAGQRRPLLSLRPNPLRTSAPRLLQIVGECGLNAFLSEEGDSVLISDAPSAAQLDAVRDGICQPQDTTSQIALKLAPPQPGEFVLDLCAGVGTKSTQAAEMMQNAGVVLASDVHAGRLSHVQASAERLGLTIIRTAAADELDDALQRINRAPDLILVDAPCLNTGVLAKRPEARYRAGQKALSQIVELQQDILTQAAMLAGPATRIIYTTCSIEVEENEAQATWFVEHHPDWKQVAERFTLPSQTCDGGYAVVFNRT